MQTRYLMEADGQQKMKRFRKNMPGKPRVVAKWQGGGAGWIEVEKGALTHG